MRILRDPVQTAPCVLVLGMFDGVHRGHQALIIKGGELARTLGCPLAVCTFAPHPLRVLRPGQAPGQLTTLAEKAALMADFAQLSLVEKLELDTEDGVTDAYIVNDQGALIPFLYAARLMVEKFDGFHMLCNKRKAPLLRNAPPYDTQRK